MSLDRRFLRYKFVCSDILKRKYRQGRLLKHLKEVISDIINYPSSGESGSFEENIPKRILDIWNQYIITKYPSYLSESLKKSLPLIFRNSFQSSFSVWTDYCNRIKNSPFLMGTKSSSGRHFVITLPWALREENIEKVLSGKYDEFIRKDFFSQKRTEEQELSPEELKNYQDNMINADDEKFRTALLENTSPSTLKDWYMDVHFKSIKRYGIKEHRLHAILSVPMKFMEVHLPAEAARVALSVSHPECFDFELEYQRNCYQISCS